LAAILLLLSLLTLYANRVLFDSDQFANHVGAAIEKPAVKDEVGRQITDGMVDAQPDLVAVSPVIQSVAAGVVGSRPFNGLLRAAVRDLHRAVFKHDKDTVALTVADVGVVVSSALETFAPKVAKQIHSTNAATILDGKPPGWLLELARVADDVEALAIVLVVLAVVAAAAGFALAPDWRRQVTVLAVSVAVGAVVLLIAYHFIRSLVADQVTDPDTRAAVEAVWDTFLGGLHTSLLIAAGAGVILAAAARSVVRPVPIERPLEEAWRRLTTVPERPAARAFRGVILVLIGVLIILNRDTAIDLAVLAVGLYVLFKGVEELLRLIARPPEALPAAEAEPADRPGRRRRVALGTAAAVLIGVVTLGVISAFNGSSEASPSLSECNGSAELCREPLADVAFPAAHNAMSGADVPGYLFPSQDHAIPQQLEDGVRGLLIDTHYGVPANGGKVKTDLGKLTSSERQEYVDEIGQEAFDAALRIRDRLVTGGDGEHQIYLCHRFCELGAVPLDQALGQIRDFVVSHPNQVLVIVNEDYVSPKDFVTAVEKSGLDEYAYSGRIGPFRPTLGEMISSGHRVVLMAEHDGGDVAPWYRDGYRDVLQETPYSFKRVSELTDPATLAKTCKPNRGSSDNPLFLLNHWIDTSPAPKPSNAAQVNDYKALLARAQKCERLRHQVPNLVAVDFYATGDLMKVIDKLNEVSEPAP